jgi:glycosidase
MNAAQNQGAPTEDQCAAALRLAFAYIMTTRGMPQIYSGHELAMHGGEDPDNRREFPGGFPEASINAFVADGRSAKQQQMYAWVSQLAALRRAHLALACGAEQVLASSDDWMVYARDSRHAVDGSCGKGDDHVLIAIHRGPTVASMTVPLNQTWVSGCQTGEPKVGAGGSSVVISGSDMKLRIQGDDVLIAACL